MQSITGFFKKVIAPSDDGDTASNQDNNEETPPKTVEIHKGDNSCVVNESQEELTDDLRVLKDTVYGTMIIENRFLHFLQCLALVYSLNQLSMQSAKTQSGWTFLKIHVIC